MILRGCGNGGFLLLMPHLKPEVKQIRHFALCANSGFWTSRRTSRTSGHDPGIASSISGILAQRRDVAVPWNDTGKKRIHGFLTSEKPAKKLSSHLDVMARRCFGTSLEPNGSSPSGFNPKRILILTKLSRLEFEKIRYSKLSDSEFEQALRKRGSDYNSLLYHHYIHKACENRVDKYFCEFGAETRIVNRLDYNDECVEWADLIIPIGGDGTFLIAASRVPDRSKPVIGFNSDPTRSEGYLCLPKKYSVNIREAVKSIVEGKFTWTFRRRIRITLIGENVYENAVELHDQQLQHPEFRFYDCLHEQLKTVAEDQDESNSQKRVLPILGLNEVYMGENVSARVSYFEVSVNDEDKTKTKNAGLCVCTGTGSTSWSYNIGKISATTVTDICNILTDENICGVKFNSKALVERVTKTYNEKLIIKPEINQMLYTIRDPITSYTLPLAHELTPRGLATRLKVKSRCFDACLVIDGGLSFPFNDGTNALLEVHDSDALRTVLNLTEG